MGNPKEILQLSWYRGSMDTYKDLCTYYTLCGQKDDLRKHNYLDDFEGTDAELPQLYSGADTTSNQYSLDGETYRPYYHRPHPKVPPQYCWRRH